MYRCLVRLNFRVFVILSMLVAAGLTAAFAASLGTPGSRTGASAVNLAPSQPVNTTPDEFNRPGNILISDQFNNRVIEVTPDGTIVWQFGLGPNDVSALSAIGVNDAQRVDDETLIAGTGAPPGTEPLCPNGCADNRVMLVDRDGTVEWQYGKFGVTGAKKNQLNTPVQATWLPGDHVLITDQGNQRVIEVTMRKKIVWQYGETGVSGNGPNQLNSPNSAELLANGNILISDEANNRAIEVDRNHDIVATFTAGLSVSGVAFASRLPSGNTLITDSNNSRIVEVDPGDNVVWSYLTNTDSNSNPAPLPTRAIRLASGNTIISDQFNHRVIVVDPAKNIVSSYGNLNVPGYGATNASQGLNGPYDAKVVGDYTGLTPPEEGPDLSQVVAPMGRTLAAPLRARTGR